MVLCASGRVCLCLHVRARACTCVSHRACLRRPRACLLALLRGRPVADCVQTTHGVRRNVTLTQKHVSVAELRTHVGRLLSRGRNNQRAFTEHGRPGAHQVRDVVQCVGCARRDFAMTGKAAAAQFQEKCVREAAKCTVTVAFGCSMRCTWPAKSK